jgi:hypothetical protein
LQRFELVCRPIIPHSRRAAKFDCTEEQGRHLYQHLARRDDLANYRSTGIQALLQWLVLLVPIFSRTETGATIETVTPETRFIKHLPEEDLELLASHAQYGCLAFVCHTTDGPIPFVMTPKRIRTGRIPLPAMQLVYCRKTADYVRCAGAIGRFLVRHGKPVVILDANGPVPGLNGIYTEKRGRKYFKGPTPPKSYRSYRDRARTVRIVITGNGWAV